MSITITGDPVNTSEQIKKNLVTDVNVKTIFSSIKRILEKDQFNFFNTKKKYQLDRDINTNEVKIKQLLVLKSNGIKKGKELKAKYLDLRDKNSKSIESLMEKLK